MGKRKIKVTEMNSKQITKMEKPAGIPAHVKLFPKWILKLQKAKYSGMSLYPFGIYVKRWDYRNLEKIIRHEGIHWQQQKEMLVLPFYLWYVIEWLINGFIFGFKNNVPYYKLSHEQEAYIHEKNLDYMKTRKPYAWLKYVFKKPWERKRK